MLSGVGHSAPYSLVRVWQCLCYLVVLIVSACFAVNGVVILLWRRGVVQKTQTTLTYKVLHNRPLYHSIIKKIPPEKNA